MSILETLQALGPKAELIRVRGAELSQCWVVFGGTQKFSMAEVRAGEKVGELVIEKDRVRANPEIRREEQRERRSEGAQKAAETRRNEPLGRSAAFLLQQVSWAGGHYAYSVFDRRAADELSRKGYARKKDVKRQLGENLWGYFAGLEITGRGVAYLREGAAA